MNLALRLLAMFVGVTLGVSIIPLWLITDIKSRLERLEKIVTELRGVGK